MFSEGWWIASGVLFSFLVDLKRRLALAVKIENPGIGLWRLECDPSVVLSRCCAIVTSESQEWRYMKWHPFANCHKHCEKRRNRVRWA
jgi:hypothetical protein